jgi:hypothetical protein
VGNNSWTHPPFFSRHLVPQNVGNIIFVCYFLNIGLGPTNSQCSPHFSKQSIPGLFYLEPHRKVNATTLELSATNLKNLKQKPTNPFSNLDFLMVHGSWLKAHGSWPREARGGSWLMARCRPGPGDPEPRGARPGPGTKRRVSMAISSALKFQFTVNPES